MQSDRRRLVTLRRQGIRRSPVEARSFSGRRLRSGDLHSRGSQSNSVPLSHVRSRPTPLAWNFNPQNPGPRRRATAAKRSAARAQTSRPSKSPASARSVDLVTNWRCLSISVSLSRACGFSPRIRSSDMAIADGRRLLHYSEPIVIRPFCVALLSSAFQVTIHPRAPCRFEPDFDGTIFHRHR
ncbi:hypothetical protein BDB13_5709 [Rhodococcus sp. OK302]|nr:hypothetical protein BDB13_5709 [Rhodococcus sp. OK302]